MLKFASIQRVVGALVAWSSLMMLPPAAVAAHVESCCRLPPRVLVTRVINFCKMFIHMFSLIKQTTKQF